MLEIHDELAAQIQNSTEVVEYIDGVSSIAEDDDEKSTLTSIGLSMWFYPNPESGHSEQKLQLAFLSLILEFG